jgi:hypothetical protein
MSDTPQKVTLDLKDKGFSSTTSLVVTGNTSAQGDEVSLDPFGVFIGELRK